MSLWRRLSVLLLALAILLAPAAPVVASGGGHRCAAHGAAKRLPCHEVKSETDAVSPCCRRIARLARPGCGCDTRPDGVRLALDPSMLPSPSGEAFVLIFHRHLAAVTSQPVPNDEPPDTPPPVR